MVSLRAESFDTPTQRFHVLRQYSRAEVQNQRVISLGESKLDFKPFLDDPHSLGNVALRLRSLPQHVQVQADDLQVSEVDQGLIIHSVLSYRILPGKCSDAAIRSQIESAGVDCIHRETLASHIAAFSSPGDAHYIADASKRQQAITAYQRYSAQSKADTARHIADLRKSFADSTEHAKFVGQLGAAEVARLESLNDEQLADEIANSAVKRIEQTLYVPRQETPEHIAGLQKMRIQSDTRVADTIAYATHGGAVSIEASSLIKSEPASKYRMIVPTQQGGAPLASDKVTDLDLGTYIYLTGFTLGRDYEWGKEWDATIDWCVVGCSQTYSLKLYAALEFGLGLRIPISADLRYHQVIHPNQSGEASLTPTYAPVNGTADQFSESGLPADELFGGQELVAIAQAKAGYSFNLPVIGSNGGEDSAGEDLTTYLPPPLTNGHFLAPAPGGPPLNTTITPDNVDLLLGLLNFGVVGGQLIPSAQLGMTSNKLQFQVSDEISNKQTAVNSSGQTVPVAIEHGSVIDSHFMFDSPDYRLIFTETPGITPRVFVDLDVWSDHWDFTIWFPQLALQMPPNGVEFGCHLGTICAHDFRPVLAEETTTKDMPQLTALGCSRQSNNMLCSTMPGFHLCKQLQSKGELSDVQNCVMGPMLQKTSTDADQMLMRNNQCLHTAPGPGDYECLLQGGVYALCAVFENNKVVNSCTVEVPASADAILRRGGCNDAPGEPGAYQCPKSMIGLCNLYVKNKVLLNCGPNGH